MGPPIHLCHINNGETVIRLKKFFKFILMNMYLCKIIIESSNISIGCIIYSIVFCHWNSCICIHKSYYNVIVFYQNFCFVYLNKYAILLKISSYWYVFVFLWNYLCKFMFLNNKHT